MKLKILLFPVIFLIYFTSISQYDWNTIKTFSPSQSMKDVLFIDSNLAFAVSALYNGTGLQMKKTTDGGTTWTEHQTNIPTNNFYEIATPDKGKNLFVVGNGGILIKSVDFGATWSTIPLPTLKPLRDISFVTPAIGFICGDSMQVYKTIDGGATWNKLTTNLTGTGTISKIYFIDSAKGYIVGSNMFKESSDGGLTWTNVSAPAPTGTLTTFQFRDIKKHGDSVICCAGDLGQFYVSSDRGATWVDRTVFISAVTNEAILGFDFVDENIIYAAGYHGWAIKTFDRGVTWHSMTTAMGNKLIYDLDFHGNVGLMAAYSGKILKYTYVVSLAEIRKSTIKVFPNPVSDELNFTGFDYEIKELQLIGMDGKLIKSISNPSGNKVNCSELPKGTYFLRLISDKTAMIKSFIKR